MKFVLLLGRLLYSFMFIHSSIGHFSHQTVAYAAQEGVPFASILVPASGFIALVGGVSIALGFKAKIGAWLLVFFLLPVTLTMHDFWTIQDPAIRELQKIMCMKNLAMLGAALIIAYFGSGPLSMSNGQPK